jgi:oligoribonuclease (3'-5' exoribonuclease)
MLEFVREHVPAGRCPLAGNTIHMDKRFLDEYMPRLMQHLHYRIVDVSSVKELCRRWYPAVFSRAPKKQLKHRYIILTDFISHHLPLELWRTLERALLSSSTTEELFLRVLEK